jgi:hypothetical protein
MSRSALNYILAASLHAFLKLSCVIRRRDAGSLDLQTESLNKLQIDPLCSHFPHFVLKSSLPLQLLDSLWASMEFVLGLLPIGTASEAVVPWFRRIVVDFSLRMPGFDTRSVCVGFMVYKVALE